MTESEDTVKKYLESKGIEVTKIHPTIINKGNPDFLCQIEGYPAFYVEVKRNKRSLISWFPGQWKEYKKLLGEGKRVFLAIETVHDLLFFELKDTWQDFILKLTRKEKEENENRRGQKQIAHDGIKHVFVTFEDKEFARLSKVKKRKGKSWHDFVLEMAEKK